MIATVIPFVTHAFIQQKGRPHQARSLRRGIISADNGDSKGNNSIIHFRHYIIIELKYSWKRKLKTYYNLTKCI